MLSDQLKFGNLNNKLNFCTICDLYGHKVVNCPFVFYSPQTSYIVSKYNYS